MNVISRAQGLRRERIAGSPHAKDGRFRNLQKTPTELKGLAPNIALDFMFRGNGRKPAGALPVHDPRASWQTPPETGLRVTWLGHSTLWLELDGVSILTDPVFGQRASPVSYSGPKRFHETPVALHELPPIDVLLLSHNHYDHMCRETLTALAAKPSHVVTALGVGTQLEAFGMPHERIHELDWHEQVSLPGVRFTATPAQHFSGRSLGDRNASLWASFVIETEHHKIFFSGDTGLFPELAQIGEQHGPFDLTLLEVGAYHPAWGSIHLGPKNALTAHEMLRGKRLMPVHWGTFDLALHTWDEPAEDLLTLGSERGAALLMPELGQAIEPVRAGEPSPWWRAIGNRRNPPR